MTTRRACRLLALVVPAALLFPFAAHAETVVTEDPAGDVVRYADVAEGGMDVVPAPEQASVDIIRTTVTNGDHRLRVRVGFRALDHDASQFTIIRVTTAHGTYEMFVERLGGNPDTSLVKGGKALDCPSLSTKVDLDRDTVTTSMATSCLRTPEWVRVAVGAAGVADDPMSPGTQAAYSDDGHRAHAVNRNRLAKGPRVHRG